jgi:hypothetical protein
LAWEFAFEEKMQDEQIKILKTGGEKCFGAPSAYSA